MAEILSMVTSPLSAYLALWALLTADAFIPVLPTQAIMITAGVLAASGELSLPLTIAIGAAGVLSGDVAWYLIGRLGAPAGGARTPRDAMPRRLARWAPRLSGTASARAALRFTRGLRRPGPLVIMLCRFVPGGRMAACFNAGRLRYPVRRFLVYETSAAIGWAGYGGMVGQIGGAAVTGSAWHLVVIAGLAAAAFGTAGWVLALVSPGEREPGGEAGNGKAGNGEAGNGKTSNGKTSNGKAGDGARRAGEPSPVAGPDLDPGPDAGSRPEPGAGAGREAGPEPGSYPGADPGPGTGSGQRTGPPVPPAATTGPVRPPAGTTPPSEAGAPDGHAPDGHAPDGHAATGTPDRAGRRGAAGTPPADDRGRPAARSAPHGRAGTHPAETGQPTARRLPPPRLTEPLPTSAYARRNPG